MDIMKHGGTGARWASGLRPVDLAFDGCGRLVVTSDGTQLWSKSYRGGMILRISYNGAREPCSSQSGATQDAGNTARNTQNCQI